MKLHPQVGRYVVLAFVILATVGFYRQLLGPEGFDSRDHRDFYLRVTQYQKEIRNGHWPQTLPDAVGGGGHAFPRFYPPLSHLAAAGASALAGDAVWGTHLSILLATVLSVVVQGLLVWRLTNSSLAVLVSVLLFAGFPYRFIQLYLRGAFAEAWSLALLPAVALGAVATVKDGRPPRWWPATIALLILSHTVMTVWILPILLGLVAFAAPHASRMQFVRSASLMTTWGTGLAAFYLLPMVRSLRGVRAWDAQIIRALPEDLARSSPTLFLGFPARPIAWSLLGLTAVTVFGLIRSARHGGFLDRLMWGALATVLFYAAMIVAPDGLWQFTPLPLRMIQFPFRLLGPIGFGSALAVGILIGRYQGRWLRGGWALLTGLLVVSVWHYGGLVTVPRTTLGKDLPMLLSGNYADRGLTVEGEFLPRGTVPTELAAAVRSTREKAGTGSLQSWTKTEQGFHATIVTDRKRVVAMPLVYDDYLDVRKANGDPIEGASRDGLLSVQADSGRTELLIGRRLPLSLRVGFLISLGATVLLFVPRRWILRSLA